jgi:hypothetical protein
LQGYDLEQPDSTAPEYIRMADKQQAHNSRCCFAAVEGVAKAYPAGFSFLSQGIDRRTLRSVRDGNAPRKEVMVALMELKTLGSTPSNAER